MPNGRLEHFSQLVYANPRSRSMEERMHITALTASR